MANAVIIKDDLIHTKLKTVAAVNGKTMTEVNEQILKNNLDSYKPETEDDLEVETQPNAL